MDTELGVARRADPPSFSRLLAALGIGVGCVTLGVVATIASPPLGLALGVTALLGFSGLVLHEVGRLLDDSSGM